MSPEEAFSSLLKRVKQDRFVPNRHEASLLYRTIYATYNPCAFLWGLLGASVGILVTRGNPSFMLRSTAAVVGSVYTQELSWLLLDRSPAATFFRDLKGIDGGLSRYARSLPVITTHRNSGTFEHKVADFLTLGHVFGPSLFRKTDEAARGHAMAWLLLFDFDWIDEKQPFLRWYWRQGVLRVKAAYGSTPSPPVP